MVASKSKAKKVGCLRPDSGTKNPLRKVCLVVQFPTAEKYSRNTVECTDHEARARYSEIRAE